MPRPYKIPKLTAMEPGTSRKVTSTQPRACQKATGSQHRTYPEEITRPTGINEPGIPGTQEELSEDTGNEKHILAAGQDDNKRRFCWDIRRVYKNPNKRPRAY